MSKPMHIGEPPSACGRASAGSKWTPDAVLATCRHCTGDKAKPPRGKPEFSMGELRHLRTEEGRALVAELCDGSLFYREDIRRGLAWRVVMSQAAKNASVPAMDARLALAAFFDRLGRAPILAFNDLVLAARAARLE